MKIPIGVLAKGELQIFKLWQKGLSEKQIGTHLSVSYAYVNRTVKRCVDKLYNYKYNVQRFNTFLKEDYFRRRRGEPNTLSPREREVLRHWKVQGWPESKIEKKLGWKKSTLRSYKERIRRKVNIRELECRSDTSNSADSDTNLEPYSLNLNVLEQKAEKP